ncbi:Diphthamide biosynthesis protein 3 [Coemansia sp. BCRC 34301]|nr:Diphthamide biosynthesis protein 3 [Coemansia sp. BCRC 34301]
MTSFYDEIEIEDMEFDKAEEAYFYPCPCGDRFQITLADLKDGEDVARCPSCSLLIRVIYDPDDFMSDEDEEEEIEIGADVGSKSDFPVLVPPAIAVAVATSASNNDKVTPLMAKLAVSVTEAGAPAPAQPSDNASFALTANGKEEAKKETTTRLRVNAAVIANTSAIADVVAMSPDVAVSADVATS